MILMDGKGLASKVKDDIKSEIESFNSIPCLAVITIGFDKSNEIYVNNKKKACEQVGIGFIHIDYTDTVEQKKVIKKIHELNKDKNVNGIIVQLPIKGNHNEKEILNEISELKDVDGLTYTSIGKESNKDCIFVPCTAKGIISILDYYKIEISGKSVVVVGRSNLVGKPVFMECLKRDCTCTICHTKTKDLKEYTKTADILIVATGNKYLIDKNMIKKDAVIIDVGINLIDGKLYGDVNPDVESLCSYLTPVPGGIGPMTVAMLLKNTLIAYKYQNGIKDEQ